MSRGDVLPEDLFLLQRGWLHGNVIIARDPEPAVLDTGYHTGTSELFDAIRRHTGQGPEAVSQVLLTHAHADHAGGVAALKGGFPGGGPEVQAHRDVAAMTEPWDPVALWLDGTGQRCPVFSVDETLEHGQVVSFGGRDWRCIHTPGHATGGLSLHCEAEGLLVTGDALWEDGFGILNPWYDSWQVLDHAALALDRLSALKVRLVIPGHGGVFTDLPGALDRARSRLMYLRAQPERLLAQNLKNCVGFLRLERPELSRAELHRLIAGLRSRVHAPDALVDEVLDRAFGQAP